jgi:hypothetical protein
MSYDNLSSVSQNVLKFYSVYPLQLRCWGYNNIITNKETCDSEDDHGTHQNRHKSCSHRDGTFLVYMVKIFNCVPGVYHGDQF